MQKITLATSRSYRRLYGPAEVAFRRTLLRFINKNEKKILAAAYRIFKPSIKKSLIEKASVEAQFETAITDGLSADIALDPVVLTFVGEAAQSVLDVLKEELTLFDSGDVRKEWMRKHGLDLAKNISKSLGDTLRKELAKGIALNESPALLKERLRKHLKGYKEYQLNRIARTEAKRALNQGALEAIRQSNVLDGKMWIAHVGACVICQGLNGVRVPVDKQFPGGYDAPPDAHPNCRCSIGAVRLKNGKSQLTSTPLRGPAPKSQLPKPKPAPDPEPKNSKK